MGQVEKTNTKIHAHRQNREQRLQLRGYVLPIETPRVKRSGRDTAYPLLGLPIEQVFAVTHLW